MSLIDLIFPRTCLQCGRESGYIGTSCLNLVHKAKPICPYCEGPSTEGMTHAGCQRENGLDGLTSIWKYEGVIRKAILALKYRYATDVADDLSRVFLTFLPPTIYSLLTPVVLVPIPLHWYRENYRGFNQAEEIGREVAKAMGWKFIPDLLIRRKLTAPQAELKAKERSKNIRGIFVLSPNILRQSRLSISQYPDILLFDDVATTGSTLKEAAKVLKRDGAKRVWGLTIAR